MTTDADPYEATPAAPGGELGSLDPGELLARGLNTVEPTPGQGRWVPPEPEELARLLPQYQIERIIGHGGMGAVYQGEQTALQRKVAIKLLPADLARDAQFVARFQREARMLARLQHPGIVAVYDCGQSSAGHPYFVMEYVEGTDLQHVLKGPGLEPGEALELITQICDALHYAHQRGVIHRDIKPANILLGVDGRVKVADFGLARPNEGEGDELTQTNMVMGTPAYMAPEQRMGQADRRADIFALGVVLYEMLTGKRPHGVFDPPSHKVRVDVRIDSVVLKALQSEPERRYQEVSEMRGDVERIRTTPLPARPRVVAVPPRSAAARSRVAPAQSPWPLAVGVGLAVAVILLIAWVLFPRSKTTPPAGTKAAQPLLARNGTPAKPPSFFSEIPAARPKLAVATPRPATPTPAPAVLRPAQPATPLAVATPASPAAPPPAPVPVPPWPAPGNQMSDVSRMFLLTDIQFARGLSGFPATDDANWKLGLVNGEFQMYSRKAGEWWFAHPLQQLHVTDFVCEVRARVLPNAGTGWGLGVINGDADFRSWTGILVDDMGRLNSHTNGPGGVDWPMQTPPTMRKGDELNTVRIEVIGQRVRVFANGAFVFERSHPMPPNAVLTLFAFAMRPPADVRFTSLQVWAPPATAQARASASTPVGPAATPVALRPSASPGPAPSIDLFDAQNASEWRHAGGGGVRAENGVRTTWCARGFGLEWYAKRTYADFNLRLEYRLEKPGSNSGVFVRFPLEKGQPDVMGPGYEVQIRGAGDQEEPTGSIKGFKMSGVRPSSVPQKEGDWNNLDITVSKQNYTVTLNGVVTNRFVGGKALSGYIGLQCHSGGPEQFRNVRLTDLSAAGPAR